jgi:hypothetical protein
MLGNNQVALQVVSSQVVLSAIELVLFEKCVQGVSCGGKCYALRCVI